VYSQQESYSNYSSLEYNDFIEQQELSRTEQITRSKESARFYNDKISREDPRNRKVPIVFHVIGGRTDVSAENILSQIDALNRDFSLRKILRDHSNDVSNRFRSIAKNTLIEFCLAKSDEGGRNTNGVVYIDSPKGQFSDFNSMKTAEEGSEPWDPEKYLNIWVCKLDPMNKGFAQNECTHNYQ